MTDRHINWKLDYYRTTDDENFVVSHFIRDYIFQHRLRFMICFRRAQRCKFKPLKFFYDFKLYRFSRRYGIEIKSETKIGKGFVMTHPYNITISPYAVLGDNVTILKGATVGISGGKRKGAPIIGNCVYIGLNATIIGGIRVGDDVVIAPNAFVNQDVPSHSIVVGNPCRIIRKENATAEYIWKRCNS